MNDVYEVIGFRPVNGVNKAGRPYSGYNLYVRREMKNVTGYACERIYLSDAALADCGYKPALGDIIRVSYNRFGNVCAVSAA